ncbi:hypothetical protein FQR65_LT03729 [Abscondita terminalis]|nr:hypothetical protein FQR65_LT03729 [Abscondita terminalis]
MKILCGLVLGLLIIVHQNEAIIVKISDGTIRGTSSLTRNLRRYYAFRGIPFAKPPIGELRFKDPQPPTPWGDHILNATADVPNCIQIDYFAAFDPPVEGQEDCLYLNVYTPAMHNKRSGKLPVMVYFFYGGFLAGSARSDVVGPEYLLDRDIVLVTVNYRVNVFGFFSLGNDDAAGNWGLKDQVLALEWVQKNIEKFCGDKNQITIFGDSAGAGSVHLHLFSPFSKGLFHRGISQSGSALTFWAVPNNFVQIQNAKTQADFVGCDSTASSKDIVSCLRKIPANVLMESTRRFKQVLIEPTVTFAIVTENRTSLNQKPFLEDSPINLLEKNEFYAVPWIFGVTEKEGIVKTGYILRNESYKSVFVNNFNDNLPILFGLGLSVSSSNMQLVVDALVDFYLNGDTNLSNIDSKEGFVDMTSDRFMIYGTYQSILIQATKSKEPIWVYRYNYKSELSYGDYFSFTSKPVNGTTGVSHTDDLVPLFYSPAIFNKGLSDPIDLMMSYHMIQMWTSFATSGNPSLNNEFLQVNWKPLENFYGKTKVRKSGIQYLYMQGPNSDVQHPIKFEMRNDFFVERMTFWDNLNLSSYHLQIV